MVWLAMAASTAVAHHWLPLSHCWGASQHAHEGTSLCTGQPGAACEA